MKQSINTTATIRFNKKEGGIEIEFGKGLRLGEGEKQVLRAHGFVWHGRNHYYYAHYTAECAEWVRKTFKEAAAGLKDKTLEKAVSAVAEEKAKTKASPSRTKKETATIRLDRLEQTVTELTASVAKMAEAVSLFSAKK